MCVILCLKPQINTSEHRYSSRQLGAIQVVEGAQHALCLTMYYAQQQISINHLCLSVFIYGSFS